MDILKLIADAIDSNSSSAMQDGFDAYIGLKLQNISNQLLAYSIDSRKAVHVTCIIFMILSQGGFILLYSGLSRAKNALTPAISVLLNMFVAVFCVWSVGYTFAWMSGNGFIGYKRKWFGSEMDSWDYIPWVLFACYTMTVVNIACGGLIERGRPIAYVFISFSMALFTYPVAVHWAWDDEGWLQTVKPRDDNTVTFRDTGGSCLIHVCGGVVGAVAAVFCGPRRERLIRTRCCRHKLILMHGHSGVMTGLGAVIIYCGLIALQVSRTVTVNSQADSDLLIRVIMNIFVGSLGSMLVIFVFALFLNYRGRNVTCTLHNHTVYKFQWPMLVASVNGALVGLVSVAAGCDVYYSYFAFVVGVIGGLAYMFYSYVFYLCLIDDPAETFSVHYGAGIWGLLAVAIFSRTHGAVFYGQNSDSPYLFFAWNLVGGIVITSWCTALMFVVIVFLWAMKLLRVEKGIQYEGVDVNTFGELAYPLEAWKRVPKQEEKHMRLAPDDTASQVSAVSKQSKQSICCVHDKRSKHKCCHHVSHQDTYHYRPEKEDGDEERKRRQSGEDHGQYNYEYPISHFPRLRPDAPPAPEWIYPWRQSWYRTPRWSRWNNTANVQNSQPRLAY